MWCLHLHVGWYTFTIDHDLQELSKSTWQAELEPNRVGSAFVVHGRSGVGKTYIMSQAIFYFFGKTYIMNSGSRIPNPESRFWGAFVVHGRSGVGRPTWLPRS